MSKEKMWKLLLLIAIPIIIALIPTPAGLPPIAWLLFGLYLAAIVGLVLKPYSEPVILLATIAATAVVIGLYGGKDIKISEVLKGYSSGTTWLVFAAFTLSAAFVITGLGKRISYILIGKLGGTTLGLGYVTAILDLFIAPATPSNTARAGGIVFPIINSVSVALGSDPNDSPRKAGHYLMVNVYMVTKTTSYMFLTAMAPNALALAMMADILHIKLSWAGWALAAAVPGLIMLAITPYLIYKMYPPELKKVNNKEIAAEGLEKLGPMTLREKLLGVIFVLALSGWIGADFIGIDASTVALCVMAVTLILGVVTWDDVLKNKGGWNTLIWYGGIIGMSGVLTKAGFFAWLATFMGEHLTFGDHAMTALFVIMFISVAIRYLFASGGAYVAAMVPVFATVGMVAGAPPMLLALGLLFSNSYGGSLTHYGGAAAPIVFGAGYNDIRSWWIIGGVIAFLSLFVHMTIGLGWWELLISMGII
ncbi:anion permease [Budviciaceae bacterium BWR-B9]|uniref:Anion permease n=1 Tax=Limnobaculum allomyrinae TaxID=2791986 RepID=A0ABS1IU49_9GAMM|nr:MULTISPECIES: anion permease [Limnobaculum]MBK5145217.1 anion permease [Limnobaculum allomyrinae]MBV7693049.1 anion permease [Limnobaculum sp. M2-1]